METPQLLASLFQQAARTRTDSIALIADGRELTYGELASRVEALRHHLQDAQPLVGVFAHRSPIAYAAVQAILAEGRAYVPLNPSFPPARNAYIARKASLGTLIVGEECADALESLLEVVDAPLRLVVQGDAPKVRALTGRFPSITIVDADDSAPLPAAPPRPAPADGTAYVLFTSGSTGEPKGVRVLQSNVLSYVRSFLDLYPILPDDRVSQTFDLTFDLSVHDQFVTWAAGATLVVYPDSTLMSPIAWTRDHHVTVWFSVPSLAAFLESSRQVVPDALPDLRLSLFCGEKLTLRASQVWRTIAPASRQANLYGPTEATIAITHFEIPPDLAPERCHHGGIPIGKPYPGQACEVRRDDGTICAPDEPGELWLGGDQVTPGYLGDPAKTAERFVERNGQVWYRTGDLVYAEPDGTLQFQGRVDFQVKVMGYRIELGEIEHALLKTSGASFCLADVAALRGDVEEIYAVLPASSSKDKKSIRNALKDLLPPYMIPRKFVFTDDIPLNANGKMDRRAIRERLVAEASATA